MSPEERQSHLAKEIHEERDRQKKLRHDRESGRRPEDEEQINKIAQTLCTTKFTSKRYNDISGFSIV